MYHRRDFVHKVIRDAPIGHPRCVSWRQEGSSSGKKTVQGSQATTSQKVARHDEAEEVGSIEEVTRKEATSLPSGRGAEYPTGRRTVGIAAMRLGEPLLFVRQSWPAAPHQG
jgi:hypothetical protein